MIVPTLDIISEQKSPLFRIMWVTNAGDLSRRQFDNNISAFHIGGGVVLSVAHNLRLENPILKSIPETIFREEILAKLNDQQKKMFEQSYYLDEVSGMRNIVVNHAPVLQGITETIRSINFDTRWFHLAERNISSPHLIIQFSDQQFYKNSNLTSRFSEYDYFYEPTLNRHTFLLKMKLVKAFYGSDIAVYKIYDTDGDIIESLPFLEPDFEILPDNTQSFYCLQSSPAGFLGRLLNKAQIEGYMDQYQVFNDRIGGNYVLEGYRYLIRGYFRFGSSGAPYIIQNQESGKFKVNAIQSEASPIQLSINNKMEGNFQYVNAIASPLNIIKEELKEIIQNPV